jgi:AcrR family transcriptional regulator
MGRSTQERPARAKSRATAPASKVSSRAAPSKKGARARTIAPTARKQTILDAALAVFAERGFETARLDDVAARAGVAKGTLYLYFKDKETLFEEVVRGAASPILERLNELAASLDMPFDTALDALFTMFEKEVLGTKRKLLIRLILTEGPRFPRIAQFYYHNVVGRIIPLIAKMARRAVERGELATDAVARYPQLIAAPLLTAVIWDALFAKIKPLDAAGFLRAHREVLTAGTRRPSP